MYRTIAIATSVAVALGIAGAFAAADSKPTDPQIAHIAYTAGVLDVEAGKQALDKSKNEDVRAFAQRMVGDHTSSPRLHARAQVEEGSPRGRGHREGNSAKSIKDRARV